MDIAIHKDIMKFMHLIAPLVWCISVAANNNAPPQLPNVQATCYLNAMLQCMYNLTEFRDLLLRYMPNPGAGDAPHMDAPIVSPTVHALHLMQRHDNLIKNKSFSEACNLVSNSMQKISVPWAMQDASELFFTFFNRLEKMLSQQQFNNIRSLFNIQTETIIRSGQGKRLNPRKISPSWPIRLGPVSESNEFPCDIHKAIRDLTYGKNRIEYNLNPYAIKHEQIISLPQYVTIQVMPGTSSGFDYTPLSKDIHVSEYITFTKSPTNAYHNVIPALSQEFDRDAVTYRLNSAAIYTGSHYFAYVRRGEQWYRCDDTNITPRDGGFPETWTPQDQYPYILFYERMQTSPADTVASLLKDTYREINYLLQATYSGP